jgi:hypothetical protein
VLEHPGPRLGDAGTDVDRRRVGPAVLEHELEQPRVRQVVLDEQQA